VEKEVLEKQLASGDSAIEELERAKKELIVEREIQDSTVKKLEQVRGKLIDDMADTFAVGFKEALAQAIFENMGIDISNYSPFSHIVDGKVSSTLWSELMHILNPFTIIWYIHLNLPITLTIGSCLNTYSTFVFTSLFALTSLAPFIYFCLFYYIECVSLDTSLHRFTFNSLGST